MMPNQPAPYNVRDWKQVALNYDAYIYDINKTGQYLPLCYLLPSGINYPQNENFGLHSYVGTFSPFGNEAINVLPSLVGASLVGVDKSDHYGKNWVLMSQDFFNKVNGQNLYLNNAGGTSGSDWWYDMMPNVFFYQLYDLYPGIGGEAELQFTTIANLFEEAVRVMGGGETPWKPAYMNYRAWNFQTMQPNTTSVPEPEAAGTFAWTLYNAWKVTGNPDYRKAAEWSIEFLDNWPSNPAYEIQLPYGTLIAARMNAELGTDYDVEKMVNWSFDKGELRNWGTIVGTWGGFDVSGLVGEANDAGNDYAFQMNGMQQAAALVPMVRYDKRFARDIGKWVLNLANASRLYFPGFLPGSLQDASAWSSANDPDQVLGYEALREVWQGNSPFSTGDAVQGGWGATNLALYGTSAVGYLGAIVEKTNVSKILKLDVLATDFFGDDAYPTFLFYNSYNTPQTVQFAVGNDPVDVYDALTETFLLENVTGTVDLTIPALEALLVTTTPAGGAVTYELNKMLVDGVVVDYMQSAQAFTYPPRIKGLAAAANPVEINDTTSIYVAVSDKDSGDFTFQWSTSAGTITGSTDQVLFTAPAGPGEAEVQCIATDPEGNADTATLLITLVPQINDPPQILEIVKSPPYVDPGGVVQLICMADDPENDTLSYNWTAAFGQITGAGNTVEWMAPAEQGVYQIDVVVSDDQGLSASASTSILVKTFSAVSGNLIAYYPFTGNADDVSGNELHGEVNGALLTADQFGHAQQAYYFNGGPQHISVANAPILNFQDGITVSCWFNPYDLPDKETFLLSHGSWQSRWKISITPEKKLRWTLKTQSSIADVDALIPLETDTFYHVAVTYDGELLALYLNGKLHNYKALSGPIRTTSYPFLMGQMLPGDSQYNFKGVIDEVYLYDYALVPDSVEALYLQQLTGLHELPTGGLAPPALFPNPVSGILTVRFPEGWEDDVRLEVSDLSGRLLHQETREGRTWIELNVQDYQTGVYFLSFSSGRTHYTTRFLKH